MREKTKTKDLKKIEMNDKKCERCNGSAKIKNHLDLEEKCKTCNGTGLV